MSNVFSQFGQRVLACRIKSGLTQNEASKLMKFKHVNSYYRLEEPCNPSLRTIARLKKIFPDLRVDDIL